MLFKYILEIKNLKRKNIIYIYNLFLNFICQIKLTKTLNCWWIVLIFKFLIFLYTYVVQMVNSGF
jgi:hypothetical protein